MEILRYYYGNDIELVQNAPGAQSRRLLTPGTPLRLGSKGDDVLVLKTMINRVSQSYPAIPKLFPVTNVFDESTQQAVKTFQQIFNLTPDGIVGKATWYKLVYLYVGTNQLSELVSMGQQFQTFSFQYPGILRQGDRGSDVRILQYMLALTAEFNESLIPIQVDGIYGNATAQAVRKYQSQAGLQVDGIVGPNTWYSLYNNYTGIERDLRNDNINFPLSKLHPLRPAAKPTEPPAGRDNSLAEACSLETQTLRGSNWYDKNGIGTGDAVQSGTQPSVYALAAGHPLSFFTQAGYGRSVRRGNAGGRDALSAGAGASGHRCGGPAHLGRHPLRLGRSGTGRLPYPLPAHLPGEGFQVSPGMSGDYMILPQTMFQILRQKLSGIVDAAPDGYHGDASVENTPLAPGFGPAGADGSHGSQDMGYALQTL